MSTLARQGCPNQSCHYMKIMYYIFCTNDLTFKKNKSVNQVVDDLIIMIKDISMESEKEPFCK